LVKVIVTIPCYNDSAFIENAVYETQKWMKEINDDYLIIIAEDGSTDNSAEIAKDLALKDSKIIHIHNDSKLGRGRALMNSWSEYDAEIYSYFDCDLATGMCFFPELIHFIENGYDLSTGSRYIDGAKCSRPLLRELSSKGYNLLIRILFSDRVLDHQCGFKAFSNEFVKYLLKKYTFYDWFWDTEAIVIASKNGYKIKEFPVNWEEKKGKRTPIKRLVNDFWIHGKGIIKLMKNKIEK
jgi:glycosyltransferase involved in cell wall biosynthesis